MSDDQQTQRYRPLAVGEVIEHDDQYESEKGHYWPIWQYMFGLTVNEGQTFRRPIPETNWRDPVGEAGYPYPPGTVVEWEDSHGDGVFGIIRKSHIEWFTADAKTLCVKSVGSGVRHRVKDFIEDYRPDLLAQETSVDETQTNLSRTDETQDLLPCPFCGPVKSVLESLRLKSHEGEETQVVHCRECGCYGPPSFHNAGQQEYYWNQRPRSEMEADLTRLRADVERLTKEMERRTVYNGKSAQEWYTLYCQSALPEPLI